MPDPIRYGLDNPHPLSQVKTELVWAGKYDAYGRRMAPLRVKLPFQTVETVNESSQQRQMALDLFSTGRPSEWRNRLIWGDKKYVLPALLDEFAGEVDLIYIDPPFNVGADFSHNVSVPQSSLEDDSQESGTFLKQPSIIEQKAYRDTWREGLHSYLLWFSSAIAHIHSLLADHGTLYVHLDYHVAHYVKIMLDEVFGAASFVSEIIWKRTSSHNDPGRPGNVHDVIFMYAKSPESWTWNQQYQPLDKEYVEKVYVYEDNKGKYRLGDLTAPGVSKGVTGQEWRGVNPTNFGRHWRRPPDELERILADGGIQLKSDGKPSINGWKQYLAQSKGMPLQSVLTGLYNVTGISSEKLGYPTQKPEALLERLMSASSNEGDLVLDCFCGSGTTAAVAEKLNRRWITCDLGRFAIHTTRKRLLAIPNVRPFVVQNLGKYERQAWQAAEFGGQEKATAVMDAYRRFILELYGARAIQGYVWLHGIRHGRMVHVGAVDAPISPGDVSQIALEFRKATGTGADAPGVSAVDVLGWDFAFELNEVARQQAAQANIAMRFIRIPREVLEKQAVEQGDIKFFELAALAVEATQTKRQVTLKLSDFVIPPDDVPADIQKAITHWSQWIDYWAVDWDNHDDTFHNMWQTYRTRKSKTLDLHAGHTYDEPGEYRIMVKVIDILGNDTTKTLQVRIDR